MAGKQYNIVIYLVDDDEFHSKLLSSKFASATNYKLKTFKSGEEFLSSLLRTQHPKNSIIILLLDYFLSTDRNRGAKNGLEILKHIKEINPSISVIMYSGSDDVEVATSALHHGAANYIKKNENSFSRINNTINWIISEAKLNRKKRQSKIATVIFLSILGVIGIIYLFLFLVFPHLIS